MAIVDDLLEHPGLYLGLDRHSDPGHPGAARIRVTPLPGQAGVTLDYEVLNPAQPDRIRGHHEHTVLARKRAERGDQSVAHARREEAAKAAFPVGQAECGIARAGQLARSVDQPLQHLVDREPGGDREHGVADGLEGRADRRAHGCNDTSR